MDSVSKETEKSRQIESKAWKPKLCKRDYRPTKIGREQAGKAGQGRAMRRELEIIQGN
jgi:hypothetical protein